jgi:hypothetical protein
MMTMMPLPSRARTHKAAPSQRLGDTVPTPVAVPKLRSGSKMREAGGV